MFFTLFLILPNLYVAARTFMLWPFAAQHAPMFWTLAIAIAFLQALGIFAERTFFPGWKAAAGPLVPAISWSAYILYGFVSVMAAYLLVGDIVRILVAFAAPPDSPVDFDRRMILTLGAGAMATTALGVWQATAGPTIRRVTVTLDRLPASFDGFTIAQVSDLHLGPTIKRAYAENVVRLVNGLKPDMVALTGDFVDGTIADLAGDVAPLAQLASAHGSYYVTGNHEYYWGAGPWCDHFRTLGFKVLDNRHEVIERGGERIIIAGVNDFSTLALNSPAACNPALALEGAPDAPVKILLAHQPVTYTLSAPVGYDLQLSGHTHAGQYFPFNLLIPLFQKYYKGLNRHGDMQIYVNTATGYWGPPLRTLVPTEITLITLRRQA